MFTDIARKWLSSGLTAAGELQQNLVALYTGSGAKEQLLYAVFGMRDALRR